MQMYVFGTCVESSHRTGEEFAEDDLRRGMYGTIPPGDVVWPLAGERGLTMLDAGSSLSSGIGVPLIEFSASLGLEEPALVTEDDERDRRRYGR